MQACVSGLKAYKRGYIYWYMHMIAPPSEDNVGHFFKVQKSRMMLLHVCVHVLTVCVCGHVYTYMYVCVAMCVFTCHVSSPTITTSQLFNIDTLYTK